MFLAWCLSGAKKWSLRFTSTACSFTHPARTYPYFPSLFALTVSSRRHSSANSAQEEINFLSQRFPFILPDTFTSFLYRYATMKYVAYPNRPWSYLCAVTSAKPPNETLGYGYRKYARSRIATSRQFATTCSNVVSLPRFLRTSTICLALHQTLLSQKGLHRRLQSP